MITQRRSGVLLHITSLPSEHGIGNLGPEAYRFADFMQRSGLTYWQILPLNPVDQGSGYSPYSGLSAFAGNPLLISPELLVKDRLLRKEEAAVSTRFRADQVDFKKVVPAIRAWLDLAFTRFARSKSKRLRQAYEQFCMYEADWLDDFADFTAFRQHFGGKSWEKWPSEIRDRDVLAMDELKTKVRKGIDQTKFEQFIFFRQWNTLKVYCQKKGVKFLGDIPFYVGYDSADVWAHQEIFKLKKSKLPKTVAGVPPDYFSETGQLWGMPIFNWKELQKKNYHWWMHRVSHNLAMFDLVRLDHFRAFSAFWEVNASEKTAINGKWKKGPADKFFRRLKKKHRKLPIIAEDLGDIDQPVHDLMSEFGLPGMKVLHFAFGPGMPKSGYIPHHHVPNTIVYTGTHDNNTSRGWFKRLRVTDQNNVSSYLQQPVTEQNAAYLLSCLAMQSVGKLCVIPMQDFLNLGEEAIMNRPSTPSGNWGWRMKPDAITTPLARQIKKMNQLYDRLPEPIVLKKTPRKSAKKKAKATDS
ncbi:4-alpha-glucanotransferase [Tunicatimonas pelagia]|uniref:4-alpha-glucanotransferase n=1 Tax=Tunicatimonas pelagia TaxID=931531 RepID=UPI00266587A7|nr:4-alpha-glucanotransferase [Tunicatimonas pelagia]WKN43458.1 4-alpha-glucanotransferase [Tunicatimonas pelagia]